MSRFFMVQCAHTYIHTYIYIHWKK